MSPGRLRLADLDPRTRILAVPVFAVTVVGLDTLLGLAAALGVAGAVALCARLQPIPTLRRMLAMDTFIAFVVVTLPFTTPGEAMFTIGPLLATREGLELAVAIALKANAVVLALLALVAPMEMATLGHALVRLRVPEKLVQVLLFAQRYVDVLGLEYRRLRTAMKARAFRSRSDRHTWRSLGYLVGMLLVRSLDRSERILNAMKCRGFTGRFHALDGGAWGAPDARFAGLGLCLLALLLSIEHLQ